MTNLLDARRVDIILRLQRHRGGDPNSFRHASADHAITLVVEAGHRTGEHAFRDAMRNARSILAARARREAARRGPPLLIDGIDVDPSVAAEAIRVCGGPPDPEQTLVADDLRMAVERAACRCGGHHQAVLLAMLDGEGVADTAGRLGISDRQVKKLRARIRGLTVALC